MKLLIAITVVQYKERLQEFFSKNEVAFYNEIEMNGVKKLGNQHRLGNWFGQTTEGIRNVAFVAPVSEEQGEQLLQDFSVCREKMQNCSIQAFIVPIEKGIY